jgi:hypothetical protein
MLRIPITGAYTNIINEGIFRLTVYHGYTIEVYGHRR